MSSRNGSFAFITGGMSQGMPNVVPILDLEKFQHILRVRQDSQMAQSGNFRRLLPILGYMYHPNMLQTLGSNDWRERLFSQNSKQGF